MAKMDLYSELWQLLKDNNPNTDESELMHRYNYFKKEAQHFAGHEVSLYHLEFRGIVLRVGIECVDLNRKIYTLTEAGKELQQILHS